jgi:hypothetical protein
MYNTNLPTHLVLEFELTPIPFLMELFIDSTGDVVIASNDMKMVSEYKMLGMSLYQSWNTAIFQLL